MYKDLEKRGLTSNGNWDTSDRRIQVSGNLVLARIVLRLRPILNFLSNSLFLSNQKFEKKQKEKNRKTKTETKKPRKTNHPNQPNYRSAIGEQWRSLKTLNCSCPFPHGRSEIYGTFNLQTLSYMEQSEFRAPDSGKFQSQLAL
jgi:hypothetical protein